MHGLSLPEWVLAATVIALGLGFPITLVLAWVFDVNAGRIETTGPRPPARLLIMLPGESFRVVGQQIDGSFKHRGAVYLLEAKWTREKGQAKDIQ